MKDVRGGLVCRSRQTSAVQWALVALASAAPVGCSVDTWSTGSPMAEPVAAPTTSVVPAQSSEAGVAGHATVFDAALGNEAGQVSGSDSEDSAESLSSADASLPDQGVSADAGTDGAGSARDQPACGVAGNYALRIEFDLSWGPATTSGLSTSDSFPGLPPMGPSSGTLPLFSSLGSGTATLDARLTLEGGDEGGRARLSPCGVALPDFDAVAYGRASERYGVYVPSAAWDASALPEWGLLWTRSCTSLTCSFGLNTMTRRLGADVTGVDATGQPSSVEAVDVDGDGQPGLTFMLRGPSDVSASGTAYAYMPLAADQRARKLMLALGFSTSLEGAFDVCDRLSGSAFDNAFERRALGCTAVVDGTTSEVPCTDSELQSLERSFPNWVVSWASFRAVRIADSRCATVRDALL